MRQMKVVSLWALLVFVAISTLSIVAMGEITLHTDNSGEAQWWYRGLHDEVCTSGDEYCEDSDHWGVELATYFEGDWAYVGLDAAKRFEIQDVDVNTDELGFYYTMVSPSGVQTGSGPSMAFWLFDPAAGTNHLAISVAATVQTDSSGTCRFFDAGSVNWWWGSADASDSEVDIASFDPVSLTSDTFANLQLSALKAYEVEAVLILMGEAGEVVGGDGTNASETGQAVIDDVQLTWGTSSNGGRYHMEPAWLSPITFDDWTQAPLPGNDPPREWDKWCTDDNYCYHCLPVDDQNLWGIVNESDLGAATPAGVVPFNGSSPYAIYFGDPISANYDVGEAAVGVVCSPMNELNPGDQYVSVTFDYFREVEQYMGAYDWTYVQIYFNDWTDLSIDPFATANPGDVKDCNSKDWKTIWYKDSTYANEGSWATAVITHYLNGDEVAQTADENRIIIPSNATRMQIRFGFNSVDGATNDQFGWIIDNIVKEHSPDPVGCTICTDHLPQAEIGEKYDFALCPQVIDGASSGARRWEITSVIKDGQRTTLPRRIALDPIGRLYGEPDPGTSGSYEITFLLTCFDGRPEEKTLILNVRAPTGSHTVSEIATQEFDEHTDLCDMDLDPVTDLPIPGANPYTKWTVEGDAIPEASPTGTSSEYLPNLWHRTDGTTGVKYALTGNALDEYCHVAYFGQNDAGTSTEPYDPNYRGGRMKGCLYTPFYPIAEAFDNEELIVGFKSWRNVEYFPGADYDMTTVEFRFEGGTWQEIWRRSSSDVSLAAWTWQEAHTGILLQEGVKIQLRFCFDSIDGYNNAKTGEAYGWMIDEISLYAGGAELSISTCPKSETSVGEYYDEEVTVSGGSDIAPIWEIASGDLPPGLGLAEETVGARKAFIRGTPRTAGTYTFTIRVRDADWDEVATRTCTITVGEEVTLLWEDFESDPYWSQGGLWHFTTDDGVGGVNGVEDLGATSHAAYYGKDDTGTPNYSTGARTSGMLTLVSPVIDLAGVTNVKVFFDYWREVEPFGSGGYDETRIEVKLGTGSWTPIWQLDSSSASQAEWIRDTLAGHFSTGGASTMLIRFVFDSGDKWYNNYVGWLVDNLKVHSSTETAGALSAMAARIADPRGVPVELQVMNLPNPVTDVHTTTFMVRSTDVEAMRIEIYDASGALVFEEEVPGNELVWHTENDYGEYLSNGIYLYHAYVMMDGQWIETGFQKLVILR